MTSTYRGRHRASLPNAAALAMAIAAFAPSSPAHSSPRAATPHERETSALTTSAACAVPGDVSVLTLGSNKQTISWTAATGATSYDVVRGSLSALPVGPQGGDEACFANIPGTSTNDAAVPAAGTGFWYLVRGENALANGPYGKTSNKAPRFTATCPVARPDPDAFLYVSGHWVGNSNPPGGSMTFDGITLTKSDQSMSVWLTKIDLATHLSVWATKIVEGQDADPGSNILGPYIASDRLTGDVYVQIGDFRANGLIGFGHPLSVYDGTSDTIVKATLTRTHDRQHFLIKYNKDGVYQWSRTFRFGTTQLTNTGFGTDLYLQNVSVLPNGSIVVGVYAQMPSGGPFTLSLNDESMGGTNLAAIGTFNGIGQGHAEGALVILDPNGNFVASTLSEVTASSGGGYCDFAPIFGLSRYTANGIASGMRLFQSAGNSISARLGGGTFTNTHTPESNESKPAPTKYDTSLGFQWSADDTEEISGNLANSPEIHAIELGDDGSVYSVGIADSQTNPAAVTSRSAGWTAPQTTVVHQAGFGTQPWYNKRSPSGMLEWSKGFLPGSSLGTTHGRIEDVAIVCGVPWIEGYQRDNDIIKIDGIADLISANTPGNHVRAWLVKLDPVTGVANDVTKIFFGADPSAHEDTWEENQTIAFHRLIPLDTTRLAVGFHMTAKGVSLLFGRGEGGETTLSAPGELNPGVIAVYDAASGGLFFVKRVPTSQDGPITRVVAIAGSEL